MLSACPQAKRLPPALSKNHDSGRWRYFICPVKALFIQVSEGHWKPTRLSKYGQVWGNIGWARFAKSGASYSVQFNDFLTESGDLGEMEVPDQVACGIGGIGEQTGRFLLFCRLMARLARIVVVNVPHHVTQRGNARQFLLASDGERLVYLDLLRGSLQLTPWGRGRGNHTMFSLWIPTDAPQDIVAPFYYGNGSRTYTVPIHLDAQSSTLNHMATLI